jgi:hypothetical protein
MFQFPRFAFVSYVFRNKYLHLISASPSPERLQNSELQISKVGFPIRKFTAQCLFAAPRDLSQRTTSFIASQRQGIHRIPLRHLIALIIDAHFARQQKPASFVKRQFFKRKPMGSTIKDQFASNTPGNVAVMPRPLNESLLQSQSARSNRIYFLFTMKNSLLTASYPASCAKR